MGSAGRAGKAKSPRRSKLALVHLWLGLTVGLVVALCGLTGAYLAFYMEIEKATVAPLQVSPGVRPASLEAVYRALTTAGSPERGSWTIEMAPGGGVVTGRFDEAGQPLRMVSVDPATLEVVRDVAWGETLSTWLYDLHIALLMGPSGETLMGVVALLALVMFAAGAVMWWRSGPTLKSRLGFDPKGSTQRKIYDLHRLVGITAGSLLMVTLATAAAMNLPGQVRPVLAAASPVVPLPKPQSEPPQGRSRLTVDQAIAIAETRFAQGEVRWVGLPKGPTGAYTFRFWQEGEPSRRFPKTYLWLDQYSGRVLAVRDGRANTLSDKVLVWLYPLHSGEAFGIAGRTAVALLGFVPLALAVTGYLRWRSKARSAQARRRRTAAAKDLQPSV